MSQSLMNLAKPAICHQLLEASRKRAPRGNQVYRILVRATERGLLANRSRLSQHMQANGRFVVSFSKCIYSTASLFSARLRVAQTKHPIASSKTCYKPRPLLQTDHIRFPVHFYVQSSPVQSRVQVLYRPLATAYT